MPVSSTLDERRQTAVEPKRRVVSSKPGTLYHYTCADHGLSAISRDGQVKPNVHVLLGWSLVWLTDLDHADRASLGVTAAWFACDRSEVRCEVRPDPNVMPWYQWARNANISSLSRELVESGGALPAHWWVSAVPLSVLAIRTRVSGRFT